MLAKFVANHLQHRVTAHVMKKLFMAHAIHPKLIFPSIQRQLPDGPEICRQKHAFSLGSMAVNHQMKKSCYVRNTFKVLMMSA